MNSPEPINLYPSVSEDILFDSGAQDPVFEAVSYTHLTLPTKA